MCLTLWEDTKPEERESFLRLLASALERGEIQPSMLAVPDFRRPALVFAVCGDGGEIWGTVSLFDIDTQAGKAEIGTGMWGGPRGAAIRAALRVLRLAFGDLGLQRIEALVHDDIPRVADILRAGGFAEEGRNGNRTRFALSAKTFRERKR